MSGSHKYQQIPGQAPPVTAPQGPQTSQPQLPNADQETPLARLTRLKNERLTNLRPMHDFFDKNRISLPKNSQDVINRINRNLIHYRANYLVIVSILVLYVLLTSPLLAFSVALVAGGLFYIPRLPESVLIGKERFTRQHLYAGLAIVSVPLLWFSSAGSAIFWLVGASAVVILGHASLLEVSVENDFAEHV